jgi:hypothetical protein
VVALDERGAARKRVVERGVGGAEVGFVDRVRRDAEAGLDLFLQRQLLFARDEEQGADLRLEPAPPLLVFDRIELEGFEPFDDRLAGDALRREPRRGEDQLVDVLAERKGELDVALGGAQLSARMSAGVSCSVRRRLKRAGSPSTNALQMR